VSNFASNVLDYCGLNRLNPVTPRRLLLATPNVRVLVVDDFKPIRGLICSKLRNNPQLQVVWQASDGLEAVQKAEELQPELILLDLSLPRLNGIQAALRIRKFSRLSKIIFVTQETSVEVMEEALRIGAKGYIVKTDIAHELLPGIAAVLSGTTFISSHLAHSAKTIVRVVHRSTGINPHVAAFYRDDAALVVGLSRCINDALDAGRAVIAIIAESRRVDLLRSLRAHDNEVETNIKQGRLVVMDVADVCATFGMNDQPDGTQFTSAAHSLIDSVRTKSQVDNPRVVTCGECPSTLIAAGKVGTAIQLEKLWNEFSNSVGDIALHCAYLSDQFQSKETSHIFGSICEQHAAVLGC
jgi:CheY-like chemotaxis protein